MTNRMKSIESSSKAEKTKENASKKLYFDCADHSGWFEVRYAH